MASDTKNITELIPATCAAMADHLEELWQKNDDASSIAAKARVEAELEDYCYQNLPAIIAGLRIAARSAS